MIDKQIDMPDGKKFIVREKSEDVSELHIHSTGRVIKIGTLTKSTGVLLVFRKRELHEHYRTHSYGFNAWMLENSKHIKNIHVYEEYEGANNEYLVPKQDILTIGKKMKFISEEQYFFPISQLETFYKI